MKKRNTSLLELVFNQNTIVSLAVLLSSFGLMRCSSITSPSNGSELSGHKYVIGLNLSDCVSCNMVFSAILRDSVLNTMLDEGVILYGDERRIEIENYLKISFDLQLDETSFLKNQELLEEYSLLAGMPVASSLLIVFCSGEPIYIKSLKSITYQDLDKLKADIRHSKTADCLE